MTEKEKFDLAIAKGYRYDKLSGRIHTPKNSIDYRMGKHGHRFFRIKHQRKQYNLLSHRYAFYICYNLLPPVVEHKNRIPNDNRIENLREGDRFINMQNTNSKNIYLETRKGRSPVWRVIITAYGKSYRKRFRYDEYDKAVIWRDEIRRKYTHFHFRKTK